MARFLLQLAGLLLVVWPACLAVDMTVEEKANGPEVVEATVDLIHESCIFDDDKLMLRRIAYVETTDGEDDHTFERNGNDYYGGIWQIDEVTFQATKGHEVTIQKYQAIKDEFGIDWFRVDYEDLWKPLYCALAARLWLDIQLGTANLGELPRSVDEQADYWANYYRTPEDAGSSVTQIYIDKVDEIDSGCDVPKADMLFVLDGSGSIGASNFLLMKNFIKDIVSTSNIGVDEVRIGVIRYSSKSDLQFGLGHHNTVGDVNSAIDSISYDGGSTASDLALRGAVSEFSTRARSSVPQICIFLTDGQSNDVAATAQAAYDLHNHPTLRITVFAVGVTSGAVRSELETIGSEPSCIHVFMLESFADMDHFKAQLEKQACSAPAEIDPDEDASGSIDSGTYVYFKLKIKRNHKGVMIQLKMGKGSSRLFVSYKVRNPGRAIYDYMLQTDSSKKDGDTLGVPFPSDIAGVNVTDVFVSLLGEGIGEQNEYTLGYEDGYSGVAGLKAALQWLTLLVAGLLGMLLRQA